MEHIDRQAIYFTLNLGASLTALATELAILAWVAGISDGSAAATSSRCLLLILAVIATVSLAWKMPRRERRQMLMSAGELWTFTAVTALLLFLGFVAICAGC